MNNHYKKNTMTRHFLINTLLCLGLGSGTLVSAQEESAQARAPVDLTGVWVSVVTEDWRHRMMTPPVGDTASLPLNEEGQRVAENWNPEADIAAGLECRAYGAAGIMRMPTRLNIDWEDDNTLRIETDAGEQTRLLQFDRNSMAMSDPSWQGHSVAWWESFDEAQGQAAVQPGEGDPSGALAVTTNNLRPGYLRRNGVPYSADTIVEEHFDVINAPNGDRWLIVLTKVIDPTYLEVPMWTSTHFKQEANAGNWDPTPCRITLPTRSGAVSVN